MKKCRDDCKHSVNLGFILSSGIEKIILAFETRNNKLFYFVQESFFKIDHIEVTENADVARVFLNLNNSLDDRSMVNLAVQVTSTIEKSIVI